MNQSCCSACPAVMRCAGLKSSMRSIRCTASGLTEHSGGMRPGRGGGGQVSTEQVCGWGRHTQAQGGCRLVCVGGGRSRRACVCVCVGGGRVYVCGGGGVCMCVCGGGGVCMCV